MISTRLASSLQKVHRPITSSSISRTAGLKLASTTTSTKSCTPRTSYQQPRHSRTFHASKSFKMPGQGKGNSAFTRDNLFDLTGKVALITGGGSGLGLMATQALSVNGAKVYIVGRTKEKLDKVVEKYGQDIPGEIVAITGDVTSKDGVKKLYDEIASREKVLDILINNAGVSSASITTESDGDALEMKKNLFETDKNTNADWNDTYNTNVTGQFFMTTAFLPLLQASSEQNPKWSSTVLFISSISGLIKTAQHHFSYNSSKAAAVHLTRMLSHELTSSNLKIRVNGIAPGVFPSEMTTDGSDENQKSFIPAEKYKEKVPAGRAGRDEDMAQAVLFAVTNQYLQGQTFAVDGGYTVAAGL